MIITVYPGYTLLHTTRMMVDRYRTLYVAINEYIDIIAGQAPAEYVFINYVVSALHEVLLPE